MDGTAEPACIGESGLIVTGTRGSGKSTLVQHLMAGPVGFTQPAGLTTRPPRLDDRDAYLYITSDDFARMRAGGELLISSHYAGHHYGLTCAVVREVFALGRYPLLTLTPEAAVRLTRELGWLAVFLDAPDDVLDRRLRSRDGELRRSDWEQRRADREYAAELTVLSNPDGRQAATAQEVTRRFLDPPAPSPGYV